MNLELILIIGIGAWLILAMFAKMSHALYSIISAIFLVFSLTLAYFSVGMIVFIYLISLILVLSGASLSFFSHRSYPYIHSLILLFLMLFFLILKIDFVSQFLGAIIFLLLVVGVLKELLYEKFFK